MREQALRDALEALADKMGERCGDHCPNSCKVCEYRNDLRLILVRTAALAANPSATEKQREGFAKDADVVWPVPPADSQSIFDRSFSNTAALEALRRPRREVMPEEHRAEPEPEKQREECTCDDTSVRGRNDCPVHSKGGATMPLPDRPPKPYKPQSGEHRADSKETSAPSAETFDAPTLTFGNNSYSCAHCGNSQVVLCEHWQALFERAYAAMDAAGKREGQHGH